MISYFDKGNFVKDNEMYSNLPYKKIGEKTINLEYPNKSFKRYFSIESDVVIDKRGYCNFRCNNCDLIESIDFIVGGSRIDRVFNADGKLFPKLREMLGINDSTVIPFLPTYCFIPYFDYKTAEICVEVKREYDDETTKCLTITYDEVKIDDNNLLLIAQFCDINKKLFPGELYNSNIKIIPMVELSLPSVEFTGEDDVSQCTSAKFKLGFRNFLHTVLVYTPNNTVKSHTLTAHNKYEQQNIMTNIDTSTEIYAIKLEEIINSVNYPDTVLTLDFENANDDQKIYIYGIGKSNYRILNGFIYRLE